MTSTRIAILGGGFGGVYTALHLERLLGAASGIEITLISRDNFFLFTPMLHEVAASDIDITHIVSPLRALLRRTTIFVGDVESVDLNEKRVVVSHGLDEHTHTLSFDHVVLALGSVTNFYGLPGLAEHALTMKTLGDAIHLRNRVIAALEEGDNECSFPHAGALTFVVVGGGFAGVETIAGLNDLVRDGRRFYPRLAGAQVRMVLVHSGPVILPELGGPLGEYAQHKLADRGIEILTNARVARIDDEGVTLSDGRTLASRLVVWTAGTSPHPLLQHLPCRLERGRVCVDERLAVPNWPNVWAVGDCAMVPDRRTGGFHPPTAQHAIREARTAARNIVAALQNRPARAFDFQTIGQLAAIGRRTGVARVFGVNFSGFFAWWLWRTIYLGKLPRLEKKLRVALDWTLDLVFSKDFVQFLTVRGHSRMHVTGRTESAPSSELTAEAAR
jgi:NADH:ubiquinone reductase (H+-translocating)